MEIYLVRHGIAVEAGEQGAKTDFDRMLTDEGRKKAGEVGRGLKAMGCAPARIISSPLVRARETAEILREAINALPVETSDLLKPGASVAQLAIWLGRQKDDALMLVGHMPDMGAIASWLVAGREDLAITFKKAAVAAVAFEGAVKAGQGSLLWLLQPTHLRRLR